MNLLAIDGSTKVFSLAVVSNDHLKTYRNIQLKKVLSSSIIPAIRDILKKADLKLDDLDGFAIGLGPGSFTSLRVGLSTIKGLCFALQKPLVGISSLDTIAMNIKKDGKIAVITDAKRGLIYACLYQKIDGMLRAQSKYQLIDIKNFIKDIKTEIIFTGDAIALYKNEIEEACRNKGIQFYFSTQNQWSPQSKELAPLALKKFKENKVDNLKTLVPIYLYPENCQVERKC